MIDFFSFLFVAYFVLGGIAAVTCSILKAKDEGEYYSSDFFSFILTWLGWPFVALYYAFEIYAVGLPVEFNETAVVDFNESWDRAVIKFFSKKKP